MKYEDNKGHITAAYKKQTDVRQEYEKNQFIAKIVGPFWLPTRQALHKLVAGECNDRVKPQINRQGQVTLAHSANQILAQINVTAGGKTNLISIGIEWRV